MINIDVLGRNIKDKVIRNAWLDSIHNSTMRSDYAYWVACYANWTDVSGTYSVDSWEGYLRSLEYTPSTLVLAHDAVESLSRWIEENVG